MCHVRLHDFVQVERTSYLPVAPANDMPDERLVTKSLGNTQQSYHAPVYIPKTYKSPPLLLAKWMAFGIVVPSCIVNSACKSRPLKLHNWMCRSRVPLANRSVFAGS